ncbi:cytochrome c oxidase assembly protein [Sediminibacillus halophilus]|uniref:Putative membrane protein n=1 Tax=Sediminibacillus halophilus TaxID=482461 RepID=A0A1G9NZP0_9BACI|nr:putative membrane protein [Sediminibacillus halophilus]
MHHSLSIVAQQLLLIPFVLACLMYITGVIFSARRQRSWSIFRTCSWTAGCILAGLAVAGPLASLAHHSFFHHMLGHLLLGMLAPLLMVLGAPLTLLLRALPVHSARRVSRLLRCRLFSLLTDPVFATVLNIGGLWVLYTTELYGAMHQNLPLHVFIHLHVFIAGYLFTASMVYIDPTPHRTDYRYRASILLAALAGHATLAKYLYGNPPDYVSTSEAEAGSMLMYYGGDFIDAVLIFLVCLHWFQAARPRSRQASHPIYQ